MVSAARASKLVYVVAGEASGDAIGGKLIRALQRRHGDGPFQFRGVGGPQMTAAGNFSSLFPMQELSVMGLVEVLPRVLAIKRRHRHVVEDIKTSQPDAIVTIDSKGFCFRVLKTLQSERNSTGRCPAIVHYVAPSIWAFKHKYRKAASTASSLRQFMDHMLVLLPFEGPLFNQGHAAAPWTTFVGHPSVEAFLDSHNLFRQHKLTASKAHTAISARFGAREWLPERPGDTVLAAQAAIFHQARLSGRQNSLERGEFVIAALVGSRENEVRRTIGLVKAAVASFAHDKNVQVHVVFPTIPSIASLLHQSLHGWAIPHTISVQVEAKTSVLQTSNVALAVSGTVVIESLLAGTPTIVIYRANWFTEMIATALARVKFVTLPNILVEQEIVPELIFSKCTRANIANALTNAFKAGTIPDPSNDVLVSAALSQLVPWTVDKSSVTPCRGSDLAAAVVVHEMNKKAQMT
ncbi:hypothetical protein H310_00965 [Aphanomyces invadans]|uniref:lipid-A-disaccharide synthase n=1 Tax=Aphanomyces invadans TaxID=157072 RepID=A0A024UQ99_9STRA|nr:hypothetical protein H310_00965 [Aphanomyces invadans]ETW08370.1 hypothetical protein H310_00965 [Aphanomyces invadans]|eukprot:XP_008862175.1 hypothetical protein H310_00965 [Aphanomyces invadans]